MRSRMWMLATFLLVLAACSTTSSAGDNENFGQPGCKPASPHTDWFVDDGPGGLVEVQATSQEVDVWGLLWVTPPLPVGKETKMVWRATGSGSFEISATNGEAVAELTWGPVLHPESNCDRPGEEWGTAFVFPVAGCWDIETRRGVQYAHVWVEAVET